MNTFSHIQVGKLIYQILKQNDIYLNKNFFVFGNIEPDLTLFLLNKPHHKKEFDDYVKNEILFVSNIGIENTASIDSNYSRKLGIICHYIADFFCLAHNNFYNSIWSHIKYESNLYKYMKKHKKTLKNINFVLELKNFKTVDQLINEIERIHNEYLRSFHSKGFDVLYSLQICLDIIVTIISISKLYTEKEAINNEDCLLYGHLLS